MRGYIKLNDIEKKVFDNFKKDFLNVNDSVIEFISVARKEGYLRVDFTINGRSEWLHVTLHNWY